MNVNGTRVTEVVESPDLVQKLVAGKNSVIVRCQEIEKLELLGGNVDRTAAKLKLVFLKAYLNVLKFNDLVIILS